jgi:hypothetical protein
MTTAYSKYGETLSMHKLPVRKPEGKGTLGRYMCPKDNIKMNL